MAGNGAVSSDPTGKKGEKSDSKDSAVSVLQAQLKSLRKRVQELERENQGWRSRVSNCSRISKGKGHFQSKANRTDEYEKAFVDICLDEVRRGNRPTTSFTRSGWVKITEHFNKLKGTRFVKGQFKNLYIATRESWKDWKCIVNRTNGWGWDSVLQTVDCDLQTWEEYCKKHKEAKQFKTRPLLFEDELDELFDGTAAMDSDKDRSNEPDVDESPATQPSATLGMKQIDTAGTLEVSESSNSEGEDDDDLPDEPSSGRNKRRLGSMSLIHKQNKNKPDVLRSLTNLNTFAHAQLSKVARTSSGSAPTPPSVLEVIRLLDQMEDVEMGSGVYLGALRVLKDTTEREFFVALDPRVRSVWLRDAVYRHRNS